MDIVLKELNTNIIGKRLGQNLYNSKGVLLLAKGTIINPSYYSYIKDLGYKSICLLENNLQVSKEENHDFERIRVRASYILKTIFHDLFSEDKFKVIRAKKELYEVAESIIAYINISNYKIEDIIELKRQDDYLYQHAVSVAIYSNLIGKSLQYQHPKLLDLTLAALLHDIGMLEIDHSIINKSSKLEREELDLMQSHTVKGFQHLGRHCSYSGLVTVTAIQHHERFDGKGYPNKIGGNDIHEHSRIISLVDIFDAFTSDRPHRRLRTFNEAIEYLLYQSGKIFDPDLITHFLKYSK